MLPRGCSIPMTTCIIMKVPADKLNILKLLYIKKFRSEFLKEEERFLGVGGICSKSFRSFKGNA